LGRTVPLFRGARAKVCTCVLLEGLGHYYPMSNSKGKGLHVCAAPVRGVRRVRGPRVLCMLHLYVRVCFVITTIVIVKNVCK